VSTDRHTPKRPLLLLVALAGVLLSACATAPDPALTRLQTQFPETRPFPDSRFMSVSSVRLHYRLWEPGQETAGKLLLLPDEGGSTATYRLLAEELARAGYAVVSVDLPAFGFSSPATEFEHTFSARAELLWSLLDRIDTETNAFIPTQGWTVGGHGAGGHVAMTMARERAQRTERLILINTSVTAEINSSRHMWFPPVRWALRAWLRESIYTRDGVAELLEDAYGRPPSDSEIDLYAAPLLRPGMADAYVRYARTAGTVSFELEQFTLPVLLMAGEFDKTVDPEQLKEAALQLPDARLVTIAQAVRLPMETHSEASATAILSWLGSVSSEE